VFLIPSQSLFISNIRNTNRIKYYIIVSITKKYWKVYDTMSNIKKWEKDGQWEEKA